MQSAFFWAPKVARKCESKHWYACGADGRAAGGRAVYGHVITKFSGMGRFTYPWCSAGALRAPELRYKFTLVNTQRLCGVPVLYSLKRSQISCVHFKNVFKDFHDSMSCF